MISNWIRPISILDTSSAVLMEEPFVFNNIKEKADETVQISKNCEELNFNLEEFKNFAVDFALRKNLNLILDYTITNPCNDNVLQTSFNITMTSPRMTINSNFISSK
jgi:hypothetical protein